MTADEERRAAGLMARAQGGDADAYSELLTMVVPTARAYARHRLGDAPAVDDVVQETLLSVHLARRFYDPRRPFGPWFFAILHSRVIDAIRRERRIGRHEVTSAASPDLSQRPDSERGAMRIDLEAVHAAVQGLPRRQRDIVRALKLQDYSVREVAARFGMSESAVKIAAHRAYRALRRLLGDRR